MRISIDRHGEIPAWRIPWVALLATFLVLPASGCSVKKFAINKLGDSLANSGTTFASDDDPELIGEALPFSLKLMEGLLAESPRHRGLLSAASSGFTQYTYVYVQQDAERMEDQDLAKATELRTRARHLYLRARDYGLRGLEVKHKGFSEALRREPQRAVRSANARLQTYPKLVEGDKVRQTASLLGRCGIGAGCRLQGRTELLGCDANLFKGDALAASKTCGQLR